MSLARYGVPADLTAGREAEAAALAAQIKTPTEERAKRRKNTKHNPQRKLHVGRPEDAVEYDEDEDEEGEDDDVPLGRSASNEAEAYGPGAVRAHPPPTMSLGDYKRAITNILRDFLAVGDVEACLTAVHDLHTPFFNYELVKRALTFGIEGSDAQRELISRLLSLLYGLDLSMLQMGTGFERLFESLDDLRLDVPNARALAAKFLARAIADEILPPAFLGDAYVTATAGDIVAEARALLSVPHAAEKLQQVWHVTGAFDLPSVKRSIREDLEEFFAGGEAEEAHRGIREMGVPHFCHEVVYRALVLSLDFWPDRKRGDAAVALLGKAAAAGTISQRQAAIGFRRAANAIGDIEKDAPQARRGLAALAEACREAGVLPADFELGPLGGGTAAAAGASAGSGPASAAAAGAGTVGASAPTAAGGSDGAVSGAAGRAVAPSDAW